MTDTARTVLVRIVAVRLHAVLLAQGQHRVWIPRALIYGPDELVLERHDRDAEIKLRIFEWRAKQVDFVVANAGQRELFG